MCSLILLYSFIPFLLHSLQPVHWSLFSLSLYCFPLQPPEYSLHHLNPDPTLKTSVGKSKCELPGWLSGEIWFISIPGSTTCYTIIPVNYPQAVLSPLYLLLCPAALRSSSNPQLKLVFWDFFFFTFQAFYFSFPKVLVSACFSVYYGAICWAAVIVVIFVYWSCHLQLWTEGLFCSSCFRSLVVLVPLQTGIDLL